MHSANNECDWGMRAGVNAMRNEMRGVGGVHVQIRSIVRSHVGSYARKSETTLPGIQESLGGYLNEG